METRASCGPRIVNRLADTAERENSFQHVRVGGGERRLVKLRLLLPLEGEHEEGLVLTVVELRNIDGAAQRRLGIMLEIAIGCGVTGVELGVAIFVEVFPVGHHARPPEFGSGAVNLIRTGLLDGGNETAGGMSVLGRGNRAHDFDLFNGAHDGVLSRHYPVFEIAQRTGWKSVDVERVQAGDHAVRRIGHGDPGSEVQDA